LLRLKVLYGGILVGVGGSHFQKPDHSEDAQGQLIKADESDFPFFFIDYDFGQLDQLSDSLTVDYGRPHEIEHETQESFGEGFVKGFSDLPSAVLIKIAVGPDDENAAFV